MVTLAVLLVLQVLAWPGMADYLASMRVRAGAEALRAALDYSRAAAVQRNARVALCKSVAGAACTNSGGWQQGWLVFQDSNNNGQLDPGEWVLHRQAALAGRLSATGGTTVRNFVSYAPTGQARQLGGQFLADSILVCPAVAGAIDGYKLFIASTGRVRMAKAEGGDCPLSG